MNELVLNIQPAFLSLLRVEADPDVVGRWAGALVSGAYKLGNESLRSGDDVYDAFGVLADIHHAEWVWDEFEDAWTIAGDAYGISVVTLRQWLRVSRATTDEQLNQFAHRVQQIVPGDGKSLAHALNSMHTQERLFEGTEDLLGRLVRRQPYVTYREGGPIASNRLLW